MIPTQNTCGQTHKYGRSVHVFHFDLPLFGFNEKNLIADCSLSVRVYECAYMFVFGNNFVKLKKMSWHRFCCCKYMLHTVCVCVCICVFHFHLVLSIHFGCLFFCVRLILDSLLRKCVIVLLSAEMRTRKWNAISVQMCRARVRIYSSIGGTHISHFGFSYSISFWKTTLPQALLFATILIHMVFSFISCHANQMAGDKDAERVAEVEHKNKNRPKVLNKIYTKIMRAMSEMMKISEQIENCNKMLLDNRPSKTLTCSTSSFVCTILRFCLLNLKRAFISNSQQQQQISMHSVSMAWAWFSYGVSLLIDTNYAFLFFFLIRLLCCVILCGISWVLAIRR